MRTAISQLALDQFLLPVILLGYLIAGKTACSSHICYKSSTYLVTKLSISAPDWLWTSEENLATLRLIQQCVSKLSSNPKILLEVCCETCQSEHHLSSISNASTESSTKSPKTAAALWSATVASPHSPLTLQCSTRISLGGPFLLRLCLVGTVLHPVIKLENYLLQLFLQTVYHNHIRKTSEINSTRKNYGII